MSGQISLLKVEIDSDPLARGYAAMSNIEVANSLNAVDQSKNRLTVPNTEVLEAIVPAHLVALTGDKATRVWGVLSMDNLSLRGVAAEILKDAFQGKTATLQALAGLRSESVSRANILGYPGKVREGHVEMARAK